MKKKIFNLAVAMSVIASSLAFTSCGEDDDEEEQKQEQNNNNNNNNNTPTNNDTPSNNNQNTAKAETSVTVKAGETYSISNPKLNASTTMTIDKVDGSQVTVTVSSLGTVTIGNAAADKSYAIIATDGGLVAASQSEAEAAPEKVLFICNGTATLSSGTKAKSSKINGSAGETTFTKQQ